MVNSGIISQTVLLEKREPSFEGTKKGKWTDETPYSLSLKKTVKVQRAELTCHLIKTRSICVKNIWIFARFLKLLRSCWEKSRKTWGDTEKNKEKLEANCTGFSAEFFGSQSVEMFGFARKTKIQMLTTSCWSQFSLRLSFLKYLRLWSK